MQALFQNLPYTEFMQIGAHIRQLRKDAGLSLRELARQIEVHPSNVSFWENNDKLPSSNILLKMADALSVSVEELLGKSPIEKNPLKVGKMGNVLNELASLPRRQQQEILSTIEHLIAGHKAKAP